MEKRKRRLEKGIASLQKVIAQHKEKQKRAEALGEEERVKYYEAEIAGLQKEKHHKEQKRDRKG